MLTEILIGIILLILLVQYLTQIRPLNFPPGPTGIPILGYLPFLSKKKPIVVEFGKLAEKYGKIFSVYFGNYPLVILNDHKLMREAFKDQRFSSRPNLEIIKQQRFGDLRGIFFGIGKSWTEQRRFTLRHLRDFGFGKRSMESLINDEVVSFVSDLKKNLNKPVFVDKKLNTTIVSILWHIISGVKFEYGDPVLSKTVSIISDEFSKISNGGPLFFFEWFGKLFPELSGFNRNKRVSDSVLSFLKEQVDMLRKTVDYDQPRGLIDVYLKEINSTKDKSSSFYEDEGEKNLLVTIFDLFSAGADTTSLSLAWIILHLVRNPKVQDKVYAEIETVIGTVRLPSLADRPKMPYLEAVIEESFRHSSLVPLGVPHSTSADVKFHDYIIPKDTILLANHWQMHHDKEYWGDPENFRPERFITSEGKFKSNEAVVPFGVGKRVCIGEVLVRDQLFLFVSGTLQQIRFDRNENKPLPTTHVKEGLFLRPQPFEVIMKNRKM